jgi:uncharacterized protein YegL
MDDTLSSSEQIPFGTTEFAENPEPRCPCLLLLDTSGSMGGEPIRELNAGLQLFREELLADSLAAKRVEVAIITFGPVKTHQDFLTADQFSTPHLNASGDTPMGAAIVEGLDLLNTRKSIYRANGVSFFRPWVFLITDGGPTDSWTKAASMVREGDSQEKKSFSFFAVGVEGARMDILKQISVREPLNLKGLQFRSLFQWLSNSMKTVSHSAIGTEVPLKDPTGPNGWASV